MFILISRYQIVLRVLQHAFVGGLKFRVAVLIAAGLTFSIHAGAASFDCAQARSEREVLICTDQQLSAADERLASAYKTALVRTSSKSTLIHAQREWLKSFEVWTCKDAPCLYEVFVSRQQLLSRVTSDEKSVPWTGAYVRLFRGKVDLSATVTLLRLADNRIYVSGSAYGVGENPGQVNLGQMEGEAVSEGKRATLDADGCLGQFSLIKGHLIVESNKGCGGIGVSFIGKYKRR
jgi:uncharacterized protein